MVNANIYIFISIHLNTMGDTLGSVSTTHIFSHVLIQSFEIFYFIFLPRELVIGPPCLNGINSGHL